MKRCPQCQTRYSDQYTFCAEDGADLVALPVRLCDLCGREVEEGASWCHGCGSRLFGATPGAGAPSASRLPTDGGVGAAAGTGGRMQQWLEKRLPGDAAPFAMLFALATALGWAGGQWLLGSMLDGFRSGSIPLAVLMTLPALGALGFAQWLVLRHFRQFDAWWIAATTIAWVASSATASIISKLLSPFSYGFEDPMLMLLMGVENSSPFGVRVLVAILAGLVMAGVQWIMLRPQVPALPWLGATTLGFLVARILLFFLPYIPFSYMVAYRIPAFPYLVEGLIVGVAQGVCLGVALARPARASAPIYTV